MNDPELPDDALPDDNQPANSQPDDSQPDADEAAFDDGSTDWVRDVLADVRVTGPIPDDVSARLDATLASLRERHRPERDVVVPLRRRLAPRLAAAAVIVVIGGVAVGQIGHGGSNGADSAKSADAGSSLARQPGTPGASALEASPQPQQDAQEHAQKGTQQGLPDLTAGSFPQDAARVMRDLTATADGPTGASPSAARPSDSDNLDLLPAPEEAPPVTASPERSAASADTVQAGCRGPDARDAVTVPATLDGTLVALVFRPPTATAQQVEAWSCDGATMLASASVPH